MDEPATIRDCGAYLEAQLEPGFVIDPDSTTRVWSLIRQAIDAHGCRKVLVIGNIGGREMTVSDALESGAFVAKVLPGVRVACCLEMHVPDEVTELFKTAAQRHGTLIGFFEQRDEAISWLLSGT